MFVALAIALAAIASVAIAATAALGWSMRRRAEPRLLRSLAALPTDARIVVLGCPTHSRGGGENAYFGARVRTAAAAYHHLSDRACEGDDAPQPKVFCSGLDVSDSRCEASELASQLVAAGVPRDAIEVDGRSARTIDSIRRLEAHGEERPQVLVSQAFHLPRALYLARGLGIDAWGLPAPGGLRGVRPRLREFLARARAVFDRGQPIT